MIKKKKKKKGRTILAHIIPQFSTLSKQCLPQFKNEQGLKSLQPNFAFCNWGFTQMAVSSSHTAFSFLSPLRSHSIVPETSLLSFNPALVGYPFTATNRRRPFIITVSSSKLFRFLYLLCEIGCFCC